jgi:hypothetical protein
MKQARPRQANRKFMFPLCKLSLEDGIVALHNSALLAMIKEAIPTGRPAVSLLKVIFAPFGAQAESGRVVNQAVRTWSSAASEHHTRRHRGSKRHGGTR